MRSRTSSRGEVVNQPLLSGEVVARSPRGCAALPLLPLLPLLFGRTLAGDFSVSDDDERARRRCRSVGFTYISNRSGRSGRSGEKQQQQRFRRSTSRTTSRRSGSRELVTNVAGICTRPDRMKCDRSPSLNRGNTGQARDLARALDVRRRVLLRPRSVAPGPASLLAHMLVQQAVGRASIQAEQGLAAVLATGTALCSQPERAER